MKRTPEEDTARQLKILNAQLNPLGALFRLALWIVGIVVGLGLLMRLAQAF
jgi:hypothetical protein